MMPMNSTEGAVRLAGHTNVAGRALTNTVRAAASDALGVPFEAVSADVRDDESPLTVDLSVAVPDSFVRPGANLVAQLCDLRSRLQPNLARLLGAEVGTLNISVESIYYTHEAAETPRKGARVE